MNPYLTIKILKKSKNKLVNCLIVIFKMDSNKSKSVDKEPVIEGY